MLRGAIWLGAAGLFARGLGAVYRVVLVRLVGAEAIGLFQMAFPVFRLALHLATLGLPAPVAQMTSDALGRSRALQSRQVERAGLALAALATLAVALGLSLLTPWISQRLLTDGRSVLAVRALPLWLAPAALAMLLRAAAQGRQLMADLALAQSVEQVARVGAVLGLALLALPRGQAAVAAAIVLGSALGEAASLFFLAARLGVLPGRRTLSRIGLHPSRTPGRVWVMLLDQVPVGRALLHLAAPLLLLQLVNNLTATVNAVLIPRRLAVAGLAPAQATTLYGELMGMALPLLYLPMVVVWPITQVLMPDLAAQAARGRWGTIRHRLGRALALAAAVGLGSMALFLWQPARISELLYGAPHVADQVRILALSAPFAYVNHTLTAALLGLGDTRTPLATFLAASALRLALIHALVARPSLAILGAAWALVADEVLSALLNGRGLLRRLSVP
ncbi:oligosaccharide flippase family protein [Limnochorda pilosa]|uniref:Polysaccharide biosynthesis protein n=1 Tax=Limnochorda pilosa TaxID=1555112 RepID=A0A0K2SNZ3_LIMPI|nr:oligosaccharide flippase family protein [Limnochorda pilosa]BAS28835.1 polysaccharide biosynthesis protein [Limnochorda pilosa]